MIPQTFSGNIVKIISGSASDFARQLSLALNNGWSVIGSPYIAGVHTHNIVVEKLIECTVTSAYYKCDIIVTYPRPWYARLRGLAPRMQIASINNVELIPTVGKVDTGGKLVPNDTNIATDNVAITDTLFNICWVRSDLDASIINGRRAELISQGGKIIDETYTIQTRDNIQ